MSFENKEPKTDMMSVFFKQIRLAYSAMDDMYRKVSDNYGFNCRGCKDNCCMTRFYHHTYLEYFFLIKGFKSLEGSVQEAAIEKAADICGKIKDSDSKGEPIRIMCPLNFSGLCILYDYRPMICRLHGIPHELRRPGQEPILGPGCEAFTDQCGRVDYISFDRTLFYMDISKTEHNLRKELGLTEKFKKTIAQMLVSGLEVQRLKGSRVE